MKAGAAHVTGIETRQYLVSNAEETFAHYGVPAENYLFLCGDFFEAVRNLTDSVDTVFCLGFFYHTLRHVELLTHVRRLKASAVIIDTAIVPSPAPEASLRLVREPASEEGNGLALSGAVADEALVGIPTLGAVVMLLNYFGYSAEVVDWWEYLSLARDITDLADYATGERSTVIGRR